MAGRNVTYLSEANLITCVLQTGLAENVLDAAKNCGAQGATISYARGTGIRERMGLLGVTIDEQKEVIELLFPRNRRIEFLKLCILLVDWIPLVKV